MKKAVGLGMVRIEGSLHDKLALLKEVGFDGVEPNAPGVDRDELLEASQATGVAVHSVVDSEHWRSPFSHPDPDVRAKGRKALEAAIRDAKAWGAETVLVVPAVVNAEVAYDVAWRRSQEEIRRVLPLAEELGVVLAIEEVWNDFLLSPLEFARYVDEFESEAVGAYFDIGNVVKFGWPEQWIHILGKRIEKCHVKDFSRDKGWQPIGEGDVAWDRVRAALDDVGYDGWLTAEVAGGDRDRLNEIAARMDKVLGLGR